MNEFMEQELGGDGDEWRNKEPDEESALWMQLSEGPSGLRIWVYLLL